MDLGLKGKIAIVTGGSDGIGKAAATALASEGANVAIVGRTEAKLDAAIQDITPKVSGKVIGIAADVSVESDVQAMIQKVVNEFGGIDILVNNAGTSSATTLENMTDEALKIDFGIKVYGAIYCARAALPYLKNSGTGVILNTTTPGGKASGPGNQPTALSRSAGISLTKSWAGEFAKHNIRVNTICVGVLKSGQHRTRWESMNEKDPKYSLDDHWKAVGSHVPLGRIGEAREAGDVICFLASARASYVTGTAINVDGGSAPVV
ncbi:MAG: SDR family oxidoreductase [SAR202 cluster bacterium]|nr:SDR family oxidoreductase [SAR202 cluster bacterium]|tara:strand:- start:4332 stop:5123 length:792 start_codon:yes stop_codon:yes gene_type:complete